MKQRFCIFASVLCFASGKCQFCDKWDRQIKLKSEKHTIKSQCYDNVPRNVEIILQVLLTTHIHSLLTMHMLNKMSIECPLLKPLLQSNSQIKKRKLKKYAWKDHIVVQSTYWYSKGLEFSSQHAFRWFTTNCNSTHRNLLPVFGSNGN